MLKQKKYRVVAYSINSSNSSNSIKSIKSINSIKSSDPINSVCDIYYPFFSTFMKYYVQVL
jgi:hypothetical protein